jgi:glycosyltransferase involved in cell wall biosynthesis
MDIDIVIASIPQHIIPYQNLAKMKGAKFIFQAGNVFPELEQNLHLIPNLMANTFPVALLGNTHYIKYHQEFDTKIFKPSHGHTYREVISFINVYAKNGGFADFMALKSVLPEYRFFSYGAQNEDGPIDTTAEIALLMQHAAWGFHSKYGGDGFGHILYNWMACGRPVITRLSDYKDKLGAELLIPNVTCLDLDELTTDQVRDKIINMNPTDYQFMCQNAEAQFRKCVDYEKEAMEIKKFLEELQ